MRKVSVLLVVAVAAACASTSHNPVPDNYPLSVDGYTTVLYYDVHGRTFDELRADLRRLGPKTGGKSFFSEARSPMTWKYRFDHVGSSYCTIRDVTVSMSAQITVPRWAPPPDADPALVAEWKRFLAALDEHEAGHKDISAKASEAIIRRLIGYSDFCSVIRKSANDLARRIIARAAAEQTEFDAVTRHGLTEGPLFSAPSVPDSARRELQAASR